MKRWYRSLSQGKQTLLWVVGIIVIVGGGGTLLGIFWGRQAAISKALTSSHFTKVISNSGQPGLQVPSTILPQTQTQRQSAPPAELLPSHWSSDPQRRYTIGGQPGDALIVAPVTRQAILAVTSAFLSRWESYQPTNEKGYRHWQATIAPYVDPEALGTVAARRESYGVLDACPQPSCALGSTWQPNSPLISPPEIRSLTSTSAYVTAYGLVSYNGSAPGTAYTGKLSLREYAILLQLENGRWLITRAVADTIR